MDFTFEQSEQGNREPLNILGEELERESYSFIIPRDEYRSGMWHGNGDHKVGGSRLEKLEEMRQKDDSETEGEGLQNSDQAGNSEWGRNVDYNEETRKTNWDKRDDNGCADWNTKTGSGTHTSEEQREWRRLTKISRSDDWTGTRVCVEEKRITHTEGSVKWKGRETDRKQDGKRVLTKLEKYWIQSGRGDGQGKATYS